MGVIEKAMSATAQFHPIDDGHITWTDDQVVGFVCGCGDDDLVINVDRPTVCICGAKLILQQETKVVLYAEGEVSEQ